MPTENTSELTVEQMYWLKIPIWCMRHFELTNHVNCTFFSNTKDCESRKGNKYPCVPKKLRNFKDETKTFSQSEPRHKFIEKIKEKYINGLRKAAHGRWKRVQSPNRNSYSSTHWAQSLRKKLMPSIESRTCTLWRKWLFRTENVF